MEFVADCLKALAPARRWGYHPQGGSASEPAALTALALAAHGHRVEAASPAGWLASIQSRAGSVGVTADQPTPAWPTSLAIIAWQALKQLDDDRQYDDAIQRAVRWSLNEYGKCAERIPEVGHDPTINGWSWAANTHSWIEPTSMFVLALKAVGRHDHPRTREAVRLIVDRQLPTGGSNYGSTLVLGQATLPQIESTGLAMLALADESNSDSRIEKSLAYLEGQLGPEISTASLCYGLLGLTAHDRRPAGADEWLRSVWQRETERGVSGFKTALVLLASCDDQSWLPTDHALATPFAKA